MNLTKLFNKEFFTQNLKKSKGKILMLLTIVPLFTALLILFSYSNQYENITTLNFYESSWINMCGLYIIPIILSSTLFSYIFKKKSVDFIGSMPINKKTIFTTNTIGGSILIVLLQLIIALILLAIHFISKEVVIFPEMILDIFIMMTLAYILIFTAANLAISFVGTRIAQIILTIIIIGIIPFTIGSINNFNLEKNQYIEDQYSEEITLEQKEEQTKVLPYMIVSQFFGVDLEDINFMKLNIKTTMYIVVDVVIGTYLFRKRKMEISEEAFENEKIHLIIKGCTLIPAIVLIDIFVLYDRIDSFSDLVIPAALIIMYYLIFDIVLKRKIKIKKSITALVLTVLMIVGVHVIGNSISNLSEDEQVDFNEIEEMALDVTSLIFNDNQYYNKDEMIYTENKELIELFRYYLNNIEQRESYAEEKGYSYEKEYLDIEFKDNKGNIYEENILIYEEEYSEILELLNDDYTDKLKEKYLKDGQLSIGENIFYEEDRKEILEIIEKELKNTDILEIYENIDENTIYLELYYYENLEVKQRVIPISLSNELLEKCAEVCNKYFIEEISNDLNYKDTTYTCTYYNQNQYDMYIENEQIEVEEEYNGIEKIFEETDNLLGVNVNIKM